MRTENLDVRLRRFCILRVVICLLVWLVPSVAAPQQPASAWQENPTTAGLIGSWKGTGVVFGNQVALERTWSLDLADRLLRVDMTVRMSNAASFRALTFWRAVDQDHYEITWLDETGQVRTLPAAGDRARKEVTSYYLDRSEDGATEWRRLVFRLTGDDRYQELMYAESGGDWTQIADFRFARVAPAKER